MALKAGSLAKKTSSGAQRLGSRPVSRRTLGRKPKIAVVIPAYNEEKNIGRVLGEIEDLKRAHPQWMIQAIVVNDGSADSTRVVLDQLSREMMFQAIHLPVNLGIGGAVQAGFRYAVHWGAEVALQLDGDGQHPPSQIPALVQPILNGESDVVVGSRYMPGASKNVSTWLRQMGTTFFSWLLKALVGIRIYDTTSGFRAFSSDATEFLSRCYPDDYPEVEAYVPLARSHFRIHEISVEMRERLRGQSSITPMRSLYYMLKVAFATAMDLLRKLPSRRRLEMRKFK